MKGSLMAEEEEVLPAQLKQYREYDHQSLLLQNLCN